MITDSRRVREPGTQQHSHAGFEVTAVIHTEPPRAVTRPTVILVDAETITRLGLPLLLKGVNFVGVFDCTEQLVEEHPPAEVVVVDVLLGGAGGRQVRQRSDAVRSLAEAGYRVCVYTAERGRHVLVGCLSAGASAIVHKSEPLGALETAIHEVAADHVTITQSLIGLAELAERRLALPSLTDRQRNILSARARGEKFESIGRRLYISKKVAEEHWSVVAHKFADFLQDHSPADLERLLGLEPGDLMDWAVTSDRLDGRPSRT